MASEIYSLEEKLKMAYRKLSKINPKHELLTLAQIDLDGRLNLSKAYYDRFVSSRDEFGTIGLSKYYSELEKALKN